MVPKILTFGAGQNGKIFSIWFQFCDIWCTILQMVPFYIWCRNSRTSSCVVRRTCFECGHSRKHDCDEHLSKCLSMQYLGKFESGS